MQHICHAGNEWDPLFLLIEHRIFFCIENNKRRKEEKVWNLINMF